MLHNYLMATLRNLSRNKSHALISIGGLAAAFATAILITLFVRDELSFDHFWPHAARIRIVSSTLTLPGQSPLRFDAAPAVFAERLRAELPPSVQVVRLMSDSHSIRRGQVETNERVYWADPDFFAVLQPSVRAGDLKDALHRPDTVVLTERLARKYFGRPDPIGETLQLDRTHTLRVAAVIADLPRSSHLRGDVFASGLSSFSSLHEADASGIGERSITMNVITYVMLPPNVADARAERAIQTVVKSYLQKVGDAELDLKAQLVPLTALHLTPPALGAEPRGDRNTLYGISAIALLIVAIAAINFVTLLTARAVRRAKEIAVRKASGASRGNLIVQFIGESALYALFALFIALALIELLLPTFNAFLDRDLAFGHARDLGLLLLMVGAALVTGAVAGVYPAIVLASLSPTGALRSTLLRVPGAPSVRNILVALQFAVLIALAIGTAMVYRQIHFALNEGMRLNKDQMLIIMSSCTGALVDEIRKVPGVQGVACSESAPVQTEIPTGGALASNGVSTTIRTNAVQPGFFELYGLHPLAGRFFAPASASRRNESADALFTGPVILNETAVRHFGFASARAAIGQTLRRPPGPHATDDVSEIIGVVEDFPVGSLRNPVDATVFHVDAGSFRLMSVKLTGREIPESLAAIDRLWKQIGDTQPIRRFFLDQYVQDEYADDIQQGGITAAFAALALVIACLGLFGLAAFSTERRTKEIGIRRAMGASRMDVVRLLLWEMAQPVLWANVLAWPLAYYFVRQWLEGFTYRVTPGVWTFLLASGAAVLIACLTVLAHALDAARARPVTALRYE